MAAASDTLGPKSSYMLTLTPSRPDLEAVMGLGKTSQSLNVAKEGNFRLATLAGGHNQARATGQGKSGPEMPTGEAEEFLLASVTDWMLHELDNLKSMGLPRNICFVHISSARVGRRKNWSIKYS